MSKENIQKYHIKTGPVLSSYRTMDTWNWIWCGQIFRKRLMNSSVWKWHCKSFHIHIQSLPQTMHPGIDSSDKKRMNVSKWAPLVWSTLWLSDHGRCVTLHRTSCRFIHLAASKIWWSNSAPVLNVHSCATFYICLYMPTGTTAGNTFL
jgi:hypothetical protein